MSLAGGAQRASTRERMAKVVLLAGVLTGLGTGGPPELIEGAGDDAITLRLAPGERVFVRGELRTSNLDAPRPGDLRLFLLVDRAASGVRVTLRVPPGQLVQASRGFVAARDAGAIDTVLVHDDPVALALSRTFGVDAPLGSTDFDLIVEAPPGEEAPLRVELEATASMYNPYPSVGLACSRRDVRRSRPVVRLSLEELGRRSP
ncbi:MAG: hypothetical protein AAF447_00500 [Myxococcota bacterium]